MIIVTVVEWMSMAAVLVAPLVGLLALTRFLKSMHPTRERPVLGNVLWALPALGYLAWAGSLLRDGYRDPTSRNLWPFEMVFILFYWICYVAAVWVLLRIAGWLILRREGNRS
jgi:hypothetical protein